MFLRLVKELTQKEGITETLKASDQTAWVGAMNNIRIRAREVVNSELIYA
ncbi:MAG: TnpV protein [Bacillota bacterium]